MFYVKNKFWYVDRLETEEAPNNNNSEIGRILGKY